MAKTALCIIATAALLLPPFAPAARAADARVRVSGTGAGIGGMKLVAAAFAKKQAGAAVTILPSTGSTGGIKAVIDGKLDLAFSSRPLNDAERREGVVEEQYAKTAIVFGTQASNPASGFTLREIEGIYAGRHGNWPDGSRIRVSVRPASDAFTRYVSALSPGMKAALARAAAVPGVFVGSTDQDAADYIERTPGSFGVTSLSLVESEARRIKALSVDGVLPTAKTVADGAYRYVLPLSIVYRDGRLSADARRFVDFLFSKDAAAVLSGSGHAPAARRPRQR